MNATAQHAATKPSNMTLTVTAEDIKAFDKATDKPLVVSTQTMISSIIEASGFGKKALQLELATGLSLFFEMNGVDRDTKQALQKIYVQAGYDAEDQFKSEYKSCRRRIFASAELYNWIGHDVISGWIGTAKEKKALTAIVKQLESQYELRGINSVFALVGKQVIGRKAPKEKAPEETPEKPQEDTNNEVANLVATNIEQARKERNQRKSDQPGVLNFNTEHVQVTVMPNATKEELIKLSLELLQFADTITAGENVAALEKQAA